MLCNRTRQLSELAIGTTTQQIFLGDDHLKAAATAKRLRQQVLDLDQTTAWNTVLEQWNQDTYDGQTKETKRKAEEFRQKITLFGQFSVVKDSGKDADSRTKALEILRTNKPKPEDVARMEVLSEIERNAVQEALDRATSGEQSRLELATKLKAFAESEMGIEAYAGVAVSDLVTGMDDRIMSKWNGGNFLFDADAGALCCIDNHKEPLMSLDSVNEDRWKKFFSDNVGRSKPLEDVIFDKIYGKDHYANDAPGRYVDFDEKRTAEAKDTIRKVLDDVVAKVKNDPNCELAAKKRVAYLEARMQLGDILRVPAHLMVPPVLPPKLTIEEKSKRRLNSLLTKNSEDKRNNTKKIKEDLRDGKISSENAKQQLSLLGDITDRRITKLNFLVKATEFHELLIRISKELNLFLKLNQPPEVWSAAKGLTAPLRDAYEAWTTSTKKNDKDIWTMLNKEWRLIHEDVRSA